MIDFFAQTELATLDLGTSHPKARSFQPGQIESSRTLWVSADGKTEAGVWECSPGRFKAMDKTNNHEICHIISGEVEMKHSDGRIQKLVAGDFLALPQGWSGEWNIIETTRKLYIITQV